MLLYLILHFLEFFLGVHTAGRIRSGAQFSPLLPPEASCRRLGAGSTASSLIRVAALALG